MASEQNINLKKIVVGLIVLTILVVSFNLYWINQLKNSVPYSEGGSEVAKDNFKVIPSGIPKIYGNELGVRYDDVSPSNPGKADATIRKLAVIDQKLSLDANDLGRYIKIVSQISCEYCCGAPSIITNEGNPACGCAHSFAMRGLAKYLIKNHGSEYSDTEIMEELGKWKTLFFPTQITQKAEILKDKGIELNYVNLASNAYRGIEKQVGGGMVGGC